jgi:hypothetical protein
VLDIGPTLQAALRLLRRLTTIYEETWFRGSPTGVTGTHMMLTGHTIEESLLPEQGDLFRTMRHLHIPATDNEDFANTWPAVIRSLEAQADGQPVSCVRPASGRRRGQWGGRDGPSRSTAPLRF